MTTSSRKHRLFDGSPSQIGLKPSQFSAQPVNFWFKDIQPQNLSHKESRVSPDRNAKETTLYSERVKSLASSQGPLALLHGYEGIDEPDAEDTKYVKSPLDNLPGAGTVMAVLDTGIMPDHLAFSSPHHHEIEFGDKVIECRDFIAAKGQQDWEDYNGHGTQCAGVACGLSFRGWGYGEEDRGNKQSGDYDFNSPAPGARLIVCKVGHDESDEEDSSIQAIIDALDFIIAYNKKAENLHKCDVISLSFGFDYFNGELAAKIQEAISKGIIIVCCASNDGSKIPNPITYPARLGNVLCIGACDKYGSPTQFSSQGREIDFIELGEEVWVPTVGHRNDAIKAVKGTSFSTAAVAGLICRLLQDLRRLSMSNTTDCSWLYDKMHNVWCVRELLKGMSVMQGHHDKARGYGKLIPEQYFKKGDEERIRMCKEILGMK